MKHLTAFITTIILSAPATLMAAGPYDGPPESKTGPGVEEVWTDQGVRYYRGLRGTPNTSRPNDAGIMPYQPEIEYGAAQPLTSAGVKKGVKRSVRKSPARSRATTAKATASRKKVRRTRRTRRPLAQAAPRKAVPATRARDAEPQIPYGMDPFSGTGILGTTRLQ